MPEKLSGERGRPIARWTARLAGAACISAALFIPASTHSLQPGILDMPTVSQEEIEEEKPDQYIDQTPTPPVYDAVSGLTRDTGIDMQSCKELAVCGTDLGQPFLLPNGSVAYLFGDTFAVTGPFMKDLPSGVDKYRAQVMLHSNDMPIEGLSISFDGAAGLEDKGEAPEFLGQWHILVNDGVSLPNGDIVVSYQHTVEVEDPEDHTWHTDRASLAVSHDQGKTFELIGPNWDNDSENNDPYQMWSMQRDGDFVYIVSVQAGRKPGPMMLFRVEWDEMLNADSYDYWNGSDWGQKQDAVPIMNGHFGEPSLRKLSDGTWVLGYTDYAGGPKIVTHTLQNTEEGPSSAWSDPKIQLTWQQLPSLYGGFIHPWSTPDNLILIVSSWQTKGDEEEIQDRELVRYDVSHIIRKA